MTSTSLPKNLNILATDAILPDFNFKTEIIIFFNHYIFNDECPYLFLQSNLLHHQTVNYWLIFIK